MQFSMLARRSLWLSVCVILAIPVLAQEEAKPADAATYQITPRFIKGQTLRYQTQQSLTMKFQSGNTAVGVNSGVDAIVRYKVQETRGDGTTGLSVHFDGGKLMDVESQVQLLPKEPDNYPRTVTLNKVGKLLALKDTGKSGRKDGQLEGFFSDVNLLVQLQFLPMPERAVKVGDTWSVTSPLPDAKPDEKKNDEKAESGIADNTRAVRATLTLLGTDKIGNQETLKIKHSLTIPFEAYTDITGKPVSDPNRADGKLQAVLTYIQVAHVAPDTGQILRSEGKIEGGIKFEGALAKQVPSDTMIIGGEFLTVRLGEEAAPARK